MFTRWHHTFAMAFPLLAVTAVMVGAIFAARATLSLLAVERPASAARAVLGDGLDEFSLQTARIRDTLQSFGQESDALMVIAVVATAISLVAIILHLARSLRSVGDVHGFFRYALNRIRLASYAHHPWGTVSDVRTGHAVPFARITLVSLSGAVVAQAVADVGGRYGFGIPLKQIVGTAVSLQVNKGAYYDYYHHGPLPMLASGVYTENVHMDPTGSAVIPHTGTGKFPAILAGAAFWVSVATVPLAASVAPNPLSFLLIVGLAVTMLGRLCGLAMHHQ